MRIYIWLIASICLFTFCTSKVKDTSFVHAQFKQAIKECLNDPCFRREGVIDTNAIPVYVIKTNYKIKDTLILNKKLFKINPLDTSYTREQLITVEFGYPSKRECLLKMIYTPGHSFSLVQKRRFKLEKDVWKLDFKDSLIQNGLFINRIL